MKLLMTLTCVTILSFGLAACGPSTPAATAASGEWTDCNLMLDTQSANGDTVVTVTITETFTGTLAGSWVGTEWELVHADGSGTFQGAGVFTGSVDQHSGSAVFSYSGSFTPDGVGQAKWVLSSGSDGLQGISGQGTFEGTMANPTADCVAPFAGTYSGQIYSNP
jgi:hypothetical protein